MFSDLVPALILIVCTDGYRCDVDDKNHRLQIAQPSFELCLENLAAMPAQPQVFEEKQEFAVTAVCGMVPQQEILK